MPSFPDALPPRATPSRPQLHRPPTSRAGATSREAPAIPTPNSAGAFLRALRGGLGIAARRLLKRLEGTSHDCRTRRKILATNRPPTEAALSHLEPCSWSENYGARGFVLRSENDGVQQTRRPYAALLWNGDDIFSGGMTGPLRSRSPRWFGNNSGNETNARWCPGRPKLIASIAFRCGSSGRTAAPTDPTNA